MTPKLEEIARILEPQAWAALGTGDTLAYKNRRTSSLRKAIAAVRAMREPSEAMEAAGTVALEANGAYLIEGDDASECWRAMIDSILAGESK